MAGMKTGEQRALKLSAYALIFLTALSLSAFPHQTSQVVKFGRAEVSGTGPLPYNYRIVDKIIHVGGHPLNPANKFGNSDEQTLGILNYLKSKGVKTIIDLENTADVQDRYAALVKKAGMKRIHIPLNDMKAPDPAQWRVINAAMKRPVYIHCKWGEDRTGLIIAKYLIVDKGYSVKEALDAVSTGGSHAGAMGGMKNAYRLDPVFMKFLEEK